MSNALAKSVYITSTWPTESNCGTLQRPRCRCAQRHCIALLTVLRWSVWLLWCSVVMLMLISCQFVGGSPLVCVRMWEVRLL